MKFNIMCNIEYLLCCTVQHNCNYKKVLKSLFSEIRFVSHEMYIKIKNKFSCDFKNYCDCFDSDVYGVQF